MINLMNNTLSELTANIEKMGEPKYRASQLYAAMHNGLELNEINNIPKNLITKLFEQGFTLQAVKIIKKQVSRDKTIKYLLKLEDGNVIESVVLRYKYGNTVCISTQVGCRMNCTFCASSLRGLERNLTAGEILGQVIAVNRDLGGSLKERAVTNIVMMGIGEPLDNYDNVIKFLKLITDDNGLNISVRNISLSTCGIPAKIEKLADEGYPITLCISLHASNDYIRQQIMPIAKRYNIKSILESAKHYHMITNRRIIIEYTLIRDINSSASHARELAGLLNGLPCHVNLIRLNEVSERGLKGVSEGEMNKFLGILCQYHISTTIRRKIGEDIEGACGQLRNSEEKKTTAVSRTSFDTKKQEAPRESGRKEYSKDNRKKEYSEDTRKRGYSKDNKRSGYSGSNRKNESIRTGERKEYNKDSRTKEYGRESKTNNYYKKADITTGYKKGNVRKEYEKTNRGKEYIKDSGKKSDYQKSYNKREDMRKAPKQYETRSRKQKTEKQKGRE